MSDAIDIKARFDDLLGSDGPAAIVLRRKLKSVEGDGAWIFPPTFAASESADDDEDGRGGNYQIDKISDDHNVCLIDSIGSQANRMEPIFKKERYSRLVPQITIKLKGGDRINLLDAGHRAADAVIRFSKDLGPKLSAAFHKLRDERDCTGLLKLAPTSLVFGVWDSRGTGVKVQRIVRSTIRAYDVTPARRSATYQAAYDYVGNGLISSAFDKGTGKDNALSQEGFKYSLATKTHGGVRVNDEIRQEAALNLVALRLVSRDISVRRYLLGLSLVALSYRDESAFNLREGCLLCPVGPAEADGNWKLVNFDGAEDVARLKGLKHEEALHYALAAAADIEIEDHADVFDGEVAEKWLAIPKERRKTLAKTKHPSVAVAEETATSKKARGSKEPAAPSADKQS